VRTTEELLYYAHQHYTPQIRVIHRKHQAGFRTGRSTTDQLFTVKQTLVQCWENNIKVYQIQVDFKQAYDSINNKKLHNTIYDAEISGK